MEGLLERLGSACADNDLELIREMLFENVAGYKPERGIVDLLHESKD